MKRILWMTALAQFVFCGFLSAQSLADVARKERERQKQSQSTIVVTGGRTTTMAASSGSTTASITPASPPAVKPTEPTDDKGRDEKYWRAAFQKARQDAKRAEDQVQVLDLKVKDLNMQLLTRSDIYDRENRFGPLITAAQKELEEARKTAAQAKQRISDLEEDLRRSGGFAGWAR